MACVCETAILQFAHYELSGAGTEGQGQASVWAVTVNGNTSESLASSEPTQVPFDSVISLNMFSAFCYEHVLSHLFSINVYILIVFSQTIIIKPSNYQTTKSPNRQTTKSYHQIIIAILLIVATTIQILLSLSLYGVAMYMYM